MIIFNTDYLNILHLATPVIAPAPAIAAVKTYAAARKFHLIP